MMFDDLESYFPFVKKLLSPEIINDDDLLKEKLKQGYEALPYPVRLSISEENFVSFWVTNKKRIFPIVAKTK
jgi:hypothetical protein